MRGKVITAIPVPTGAKAEPRKRQRKCKICGKVLSMYNENKYCFVHVMKGFEKELGTIKDKQFASYKKHLKETNRQNKEKKRVQLSDD